MLLTCVSCGVEFSDRQLILGKERHLHGRLQCLECLPFKPRRSPTFITHRPPKVLVCEHCGKTFPAKLPIEEKVRSLYRRRFCLECSPFGAHNSSRTPPGSLEPAALAELRRKRRNAKTYRYQKKTRRSNKLRLVDLFGGACIMCGYRTTPAALEFHHRDATTKESSVGSSSGTWARVLAEAQKCDLLCANCHRLRHLLEKPHVRNEAIAQKRLERKARAVAIMGEVCDACGRSAPPVVFEFHHRNASEKAFGISEDGIMRSWQKVLAELQKCVMLCANCHREVHAGVRDLDKGLAEDALEYAA